MEKGFGKKIFYAVAVVIFAVVCFCAFQYNTPYWEKYKQLLLQYEDVQKDTVELRLKLDELHEKQIRFAQDHEFVAEVARENGYVCPGEIVFTYNPEEDN